MTEVRLVWLEDGKKAMSHGFEGGKKAPSRRDHHRSGQKGKKEKGRTRSESVEGPKKHAQG